MSSPFTSVFFFPACISLSPCEGVTVCCNPVDLRASSYLSIILLLDWSSLATVSISSFRRFILEMTHTHTHTHTQTHTHTPTHTHTHTPTYTHTHTHTHTHTQTHTHTHTHIVVCYIVGLFCLQAFDIDHIRVTLHTFTVQLRAW